MASRPGRDTATFRRLAATLRRERRDCWLCGQPIDYTLTDGPDAYTTDHIHPLSTHPELAEVYSNLDAAHAACNTSRGNRAPSAGLGNGPKPW